MTTEERKEIATAIRDKNPNHFAQSNVSPCVGETYYLLEWDNTSVIAMKQGQGAITIQASCTGMDGFHIERNRNKDGMSMILVTFFFYKWTGPLKEIGIESSFLFSVKRIFLK